MAQHGPAPLIRAEALPLYELGTRKVMRYELRKLGRIWRRRDQSLAGFPGFSRRCEVAGIILEAPGREIAAEVDMCRAKYFGADDAEPGRLEKSRAFGLIETPERVQRSGRAVIDPCAIITKDAVDLTCQPARLGDQIEQKCGNDAIHGAVGEGGLESVHR